MVAPSVTYVTFYSLNPLYVINESNIVRLKKFRREYVHQFVIILTLNTPITTKVVRFSRLLKCLRSPYGKSVDPDQTDSIGAVCSGSTLFASILTLSVM